MSREAREPFQLNQFQLGEFFIEVPAFITEIRPHQVQALESIVDLFRQGYTTVLLDAPTGAGKTLIGEMTRQVMTRGQNSETLYVCTTRGLQDQFLEDFPYARTIKGRSNYPTLDRPDDFGLPHPRGLDCSHCQKVWVKREAWPACNECPIIFPGDTTGQSGSPHCPNCHPVEACPYTVEKEMALAAPITVANTAYAITEVNYVGQFRRKKFWVMDESDTIENVLMSFVEFVTSKRALTRANLRALKPRQGVGSPEEWIQWLKGAQKSFQDVLADVSREVAAYGSEQVPRELLREQKAWSSRVVDAERVRDSIAANPENWVLDGYQGGHMVFKPVTVSEFANEYLWQWSERRLLMSATPISDWQMADDLGLQEGTWASVRVDSQFEPSRRRVVVQGRADMTAKKKGEEWPKMADAVWEIMRVHPDERILVHTVSYELARFLYEELTRANAMADGSRTILTYSQANERERVLDEYITTHAAVLLASSLDRGVDLPDDDTRVIVIAKCPFPYLGDKQVQQRFYGTGARGRSWYATQTVRKMVQMTGRGMRHADDWCVSYILDKQFGSNVWKNSRHLVPEWWKAALEWRL